MDRKHASAVVEADERIDVALEDQTTAECRAPLVGGETRWQHHSDPAAMTRERHSPLGEQLVSVEVAGRLCHVHAGIAGESKNWSVARACMSPRFGGPVVGANHVPGRIADDGVETGEQ